MEQCEPQAQDQIESLRRRIEELEFANAELSRISHTDGLTGLPNQRAFRAALAREIKRSQRSDAPLVLALFDVDDFKAINDGHGHAVGDAILSLVAAQMKGSMREGDVLARYGGEEFALLAPATNLAGGLALAEKMRLAVSLKTCSVIGLEGPQWVRVTLSAGVALYRGDDCALFNDADRALYEAKNAGKDCVVASI
ncbi:MAG: GGDEF domain-containing protein [Myxococcota bacterium]